MREFNGQRGDIKISGVEEGRDIEIDPLPATPRKTSFSLSAVRRSGTGLGWNDHVTASGAKRSTTNFGCFDEISFAAKSHGDLRLVLLRDVIALDKFSCQRDL